MQPDNMEFDEYGQPKQQKMLPIVNFYLDPLSGHEMVSIKMPADRQSGIISRADRGTKIKGKYVPYNVRFAEQYKRFKASMQQVVDGTPIAESPFLNPQQIASLKALNVLTVEQLAALEGQPLRNIGVGGRALKDAATDWLADKQGASRENELASENERLKALLAERDAPKEGQQNMSRFEAMADDDLKAFIAEHTGAKPRGNPSHETLVRMAEEVASHAAEAA